MAKDNGGPAFPASVFHDEGIDGESFVETKGGMTLRDYFAAQALNTLKLRRSGGHEIQASLDTPESRTTLAHLAVLHAIYAYAVADAMLLERAK